MTPEQIAELRRLCEAANKVSPLSGWIEDGFNDRSGGESYRQSTIIGEVRPYTPPGLDMSGVLVDTCNADSSLSPDDRYSLGAFIAAIANAADALLSAAEESAALRAENARLREALEGIMIGGNHLAWSLIARLGPSFPNSFPPEKDKFDALEEIGPGVNYDIWTCWAAIMRARAALERAP